MAALGADVSRFAPPSACEHELRTPVAGRLTETLLGCLVVMDGADGWWEDKAMQGCAFVASPITQFPSLGRIAFADWTFYSLIIPLIGILLQNACQHCVDWCLGWSDMVLADKATGWRQTSVSTLHYAREISLI